MHGKSCNLYQWFNAENDSLIYCWVYQPSLPTISTSKLFVWILCDSNCLTLQTYIFVQRIGTFPTLLSVISCLTFCRTIYHKAINWVKVSFCQKDGAKYCHTWTHSHLHIYTSFTFFRVWHSGNSSRDMKYWPSRDRCHPQYTRSYTTLEHGFQTWLMVDGWWMLFSNMIVHRWIIIHSIYTLFTTALRYQVHICGDEI